MRVKKRHSFKDVRLRDVAFVRLGHPFRGTVKNYDDGDVRVIQVRDIKDTGDICLESVIKTKLMTKKNPDWLQKGDLLFVAKGSRHTCALVEDSLDLTLCSPHFFVVRLKSEFRDVVIPDFICWQLNQQSAQRYFTTTAEGTMYLSIRRQVLEDVPIKILPIQKQKHLADLLRCVVREKSLLLKLIENRQQQIDAIAFNFLESSD